MNDYELLENFPFRPISDPERVVHLNKVGRGLLELFFLCSETTTSTAVLTWPIRIENVAILHALEGLRRLVNKNNEGNSLEPVRLYTCFWPWKPRTYMSQKRLLVDRKELVAGNLRFLRSQRNNQLSVDYSLHMSLNRVRDLDPEEKVKQTRGHRSTLFKHPELRHPTLFEITPQSQFHKYDPDHTTLGEDGFLNRIKKYIRSCPSFSDSRLFEIAKAPFFLLGIPEDYKVKHLRNGYYDRRSPDIILMDLLNVYDSVGSTWQEEVAKLLELLSEMFSTHENGIPPVMAVSDDPIVFNRLSFKLLADYEGRRKKSRKIHRYSYLNVSHSLFDENKSVDMDSPVPSVMVGTFAEEMADLFRLGQALRNKLREIGESDLAEQINKLNGVVCSCLNMPGGLDNYMAFLQDYCEQSRRNIQSIALRPLEEWINTKQLIDNGRAGAERTEAESYLNQCRTVIDSLKDSTPLQSRIDEFYRKLCDKDDTYRCAVIFPTKLMKSFAEWMIERLNYDNSKISLFDIRHATDLKGEYLGQFENVFIILPRQKYLSLLLCQNVIPGNITLICDGGTVLSLLRFFETIDKIPGLDILKPRIVVLINALKGAAENRIKLLGDLDEISIISNSLIYDLREYEPGSYQGHPVVIHTEEGTNISAYEGSEILQYREENEIQPFSKVLASQLHRGDKFFIITHDFLDAAADKINISRMAADSLMNYHVRVLECVLKMRGFTLREKAEEIRHKMRIHSDNRDIGEGESVNNIIRWIHVDQLLELPRELVKPQAPKNRSVFKLFMTALSISEAEAEWFWAAAIQSTRKMRIRAGLDRNRVFYKLLLDPTSVEKYFQGDKGDLRYLTDIACRNVFTVTNIIKEHDDEDTESSGS